MVERYRGGGSTDDNVTDVRRVDRTNAERQQRHRDKKRAEALATALPLSVTAVPVTPVSAAITPTVTRLGDGVVAVATFGAAVGVAAVSALFSITGMTHVFSGSFVAVIAMGIALECAKLTAIAWLGRNSISPLWVGITTLVALLMTLSAIGTFGFLSAAHISRAATNRALINLRAADVEAQTKIGVAILSDIDGRVSQIDAGINETIRRGRAVAAMSLADQQKRSRADLLVERDQAARQLALLEIEAAKVDTDRAEQAADTGPIRYLAALIGVGDEQAVRGFILLVSVLLDPLACALLLASTRRAA